MAKTVVLGAGLSGLVAAIHLAREGKEVLVLEKEPGIGGSPRMNPSIHLTLFKEERRFWDEVGLPELAGELESLESLDLRVKGDPFDFDIGEMHLVERGPRGSSIDVRLHALALEAGVSFEFGQTGGRVTDLPPGSIVAVGHEDLLYEGEGVRTSTFHGWSALGGAEESERSMFVYMDDYATDALYGGAYHGLWYGLVYSMKPVKEKDLPRCREILEKEAGVKNVKWRPFAATVPLRNIVAPRFLYKDRVLAGAFAGANDPLSGLGINAAFLTGKAAALAVTRPDEAGDFFKKHIRRHGRLVSARLGMSFIPAPVRLAAFRAGLRRPGTPDAVRNTLEKTLPGYAL